MGYQLVESITLASAASSIEFTSIPQDGVDLQILVSARHDGTSTIFRMTLNSDTGTNYNLINLRGSGSGVTSGTFTGLAYFLAGEQDPSTFTANTFGNAALYISNYTSSNAKSLSSDSVSENNATAAWASLEALQYSGTSPITSVQLIHGSGNFVTGTTASLYKITAD